MPDKICPPRGHADVLTILGEIAEIAHELDHTAPELAARLRDAAARVSASARARDAEIRTAVAPLFGAVEEVLEPRQRVALLSVDYARHLRVAVEHARGPFGVVS
jgi:hypothetical protein